MRFFLKKLAYLVLTLALANASLQTLYASNDSCSDMDMSMEMSMNMEMDAQANDKHCQSQKMKQPCSCENCRCDMCITLQANLPTLTSQFFLSSLLVSNIETSTAHQYTQFYNNPLLRPPIA